jgi:FdrA protein
MDALESGCDVMIFSDNVPVEQEVALKQYAAERGLLVMGPDCGTAVVGGVGLGFANTTEPGPVGLVAASGTGCQQLLALLDHAGVGVTDALGVGGRDLSAAVGGLSTLEGMRRLDADADVELIVVVSKPPAPEVAAAIGSYADRLGTPVQLALLGDGQPDLTAAAEAILRALGREVPEWPVEGTTSSTATGDRLEGLFVGGTLCSESRLIAEPVLGADRSRFIDFGDDEYTQGRAHPMIDPALRTEEIARVGADPATGVLLLDVVLGHGAEPDPAAALAPVLSGLSVPVVASVVGTRLDPQDRARQVRALVEAGVEVHLSNAGATRRALELLAPRPDGADR